MKYAVQGVYRGSWVVLFYGFKKPRDAARKMRLLSERNPLCRYRWIEHEAARTPEEA